jgi:hypothetical protein
VIDRLAPYAKALILLMLIVLAGVAEALGLDLGLDVEHYVSLLGADLVVFLTPAPGYRAPSEAGK